MIRKILFWSHLSAGVSAGLFIVIMAATGVLLSFERQVLEFVDGDVRSVAVPGDARPRPLNDLLQSVRRAGYGDPVPIVVRDEPRAAMQVFVGRAKTVYLDPYSGAVLGISSRRAHDFFFGVERLHRSLGAPLGSKSIGRWLTGISNIVFSVLMFSASFFGCHASGTGTPSGLSLRSAADCAGKLVSGIGITYSESGVHYRCSSSPSPAL
jgi:uncharacterized iron-regulated membrane protein